MSFESESAPMRIRENPLLRSGLALAGANARQSVNDDDDILSAAEVAQLDSRFAWLLGWSCFPFAIAQLVMSRVKSGDGVYGFRCALILAGAQSQLVSLWKVSDNATKDLMIKYYERLLKGEGRSGRSAAFRAARDDEE